MTKPGRDSSAAARDGLSAFATSGPRTLAEAPRFDLVDVQRIASDVRLEYEVSG